MTIFPNYVPDFSISINDEPIPSALRASITSVRFEDGVPSMAEQIDEEGLTAADRVEIEFANVDLRWLQQHIRGLGIRAPSDTKIGPVRVKNTSAFALGPTEGLVQQMSTETQPDGLFDMDNKLELSLGYAPDGLKSMFLGEITGLQAEFPTEGIPSMRLVAHDYLHRLADGRYARGFGLIPDYIIAAILSAENLLVTAIDPLVSSASTAMTIMENIFEINGMKQRGSDLSLLKEIAEIYDADFWVEGDVLFLSRLLGKDWVFDPALSLIWGQNLLSFKPQVSTIGQVIGVAKKFKIPLIQPELSFMLTAVWDFEREALKISIVPGAVSAELKTGLGGPILRLMNSKLRSSTDIVTAALAITRVLRNKVNNRLKGSGTALGDPRIKAGAIIRLDELGPDFSGNYRVTSATHTIDKNGYRTAFNVRQEIIP